MILPIIIVTSEQALKEVPASLRDGSLALGATTWQTIRRNVLPYSYRGMVKGALLGIARAAGETAPILFTVAAFYIPRMPRSIFDQVMALPYHLYILSTQHPEAETVRSMQYGTAAVLLALVLGISLGGILLRVRLQTRRQW